MYVEWLAKGLDCDIKENASLSDIASYDAVICGGIYAVRLNRVKLIMKNLDKLAGKKPVLFTAGPNAERPDELEVFWKKILGDAVREQIPHFYLRGGFNYRMTGGVNRLKILLPRMKRNCLPHMKRLLILLPEKIRKNSAISFGMKII